MKLKYGIYFSSNCSTKAFSSFFKSQQKNRITFTKTQIENLFFESKLSNKLPTKFKLLINFCWTEKLCPNFSKILQKTFSENFINLSIEVDQISDVNKLMIQFNCSIRQTETAPCFAFKFQKFPHNKQQRHVPSICNKQALK